jgi:hypothetical protein
MGTTHSSSIYTIYYDFFASWTCLALLKVVVFNLFSNLNKPSRKHNFEKSIKHTN